MQVGSRFFSFVILIGFMTLGTSLSTADVSDGTDPVLSSISGSLSIGDIAGGTVINNILFRTNGVDRVYMDANGRLGIGVPTPNSTLDVNGTLAVSGAANLNGAVTVPSTLDVTGGTLTVGSNTQNRSIVLNGANTQNRSIFWRTGSSTRWAAVTNSDAETGSDAGSAWQLQAFADGGAFIDAPISVVRAASGSISLRRPITTTYGMTVNGQATLSGILLNGGSSGQGAIYSTGTLGLALQSKTGSQFDFSLLSPSGGGSYIMRVPTGTTTAEFPNNVTVGGTTTVTGSVTSLSTTAFIQDGPANVARDALNLRTAGVNRWIIRNSAATELGDGTNSGSSFQLIARADNGALIDNVIDITRAAGGLMSISRPLAVAGTTTLNGAVTVPSTLDVTGGTLTVGSNTQNRSIVLNGANTQNRFLYWRTGGSTRWAAVTNADAETGTADAGSAWQLQAYTDGGAFIDAPISIVRAASGSISLRRPINTSYGMTVNGQATLSGILLNGGSSGQGAIYSTGTLGLALQSKTGSQFDFSLLSPSGGGSYIMRVPTGTTTAEFPNNVTIGGTSSLSGPLTVAGPTNLNGAVAVNYTLAVTGAQTNSGAITSNANIYMPTKSTGIFFSSSGNFGSGIFNDVSNTINFRNGSSTARGTLDALGNWVFATPAAFSSTVTVGGTTTVTGSVTSLSTTAFIQDGPANVARDALNLRTAGVNRWIIRNSAATEFGDGTNSGSSFQLIARADNGALIDNVIDITRAAGGLMSISRPLAVAGNLGIGNTPVSTSAALSIKATQPWETNYDNTLELIGSVANNPTIRLRSSQSATSAWISAPAGGGMELGYELDADPSNHKRAIVITPGADVALASDVDGQVIVGSLNRNTTPGVKLDVEGDARVSGALIAQTVKTNSWGINPPDYVFEDGYKLPSLEQVDDFVRKNKHLPEVPSAKQIKDQGLDLAEMNLVLLKKVEELTLHAIRQEKELKRQAEEISRLKRF